jgi:hypothetical protein
MVSGRPWLRLEAIMAIWAVWLRARSPEAKLRLAFLCLCLGLSYTALRI